MVRLLIALSIALGAHGLLLALDLHGPKRQARARPVPPVVTMTLGHRQPPERPAEPAPKTPMAETREIVPVQAAPAVQVPAPKKTAVAKQKVFPRRKAAPRRRQTKTTPARRPAEPMVPGPPASAPVPQESAKASEAGTTPSGSGIVREATPLYRLNTPPRYPRMARRRGHEGTVTLEVLVASDGRVGNLRVLTSSGHSALDEAAITAVRKWVFEPGRRGEEATAMWVRVPIRFALK